MSRVLLVHWNQAEAETNAERLMDAGYEVDIHWAEQDSVKLRNLKNKPVAIVIDLARLPSHGMAVGTFLRQQKPTRNLPLVFIQGAADKTARVKKQLPDAVYTTWGRIRSALKKAIARPPESPVVPDTMAGYSGTPLPKKLGIKAESTVALLNAPDDFEDTLGELPDGVTIKRQARGSAEVILLFVLRKADLTKRFAAAERTMSEGGPDVDCLAQGRLPASKRIARRPTSANTAWIASWSTSRFVQSTTPGRACAFRGGRRGER